MAHTLRLAARPAPRRTHASAFGPMMVSALFTTLVVMVVCAGVAAMFGPPDAVTASVAGVFLAAQFFAFGAIGLRMLLEGPHGGWMFGALAVYTIQVVALGYLLTLIPSDAVPAPTWFAVAAATETIAWQAAQCVALIRTRVPLYGSVAEGGQA